MSLHEHNEGSNPVGATRMTTMDTYEFTCPECAQVIEVNDQMREAILESGCPVCTADVDDGSFVRETSPE